MCLVGTPNEGTSDERSTLNAQRSTLNAQRSTLNAQRSTLNAAIFIALIAVLFTAAGAIYSKTHRLVLAASIPLQVDESTLDFGLRWAHETFDWNVKLQNQSSAHVVIDRVETSCDCTSLIQSKFEVASGRTVEMPFQIAPSKENGVDLSRRFTQKVRVFVRGQPVPLEFQIRGTIQCVARFSPEEVYFAGILEEECGQATRECILRSSVPFSRITVIERDSAPIRFDVRTKAESPELNVYRLIISPKPGTTSGEFDCRIGFNCIPLDDSIKQVPPIELRVNGNVIGDVVVEPSQFDLGVIRDAQFTLNAHVKSRSKRAIVVRKPIQCPNFIRPPTTTVTDLPSEVLLQIPWSLTENDAGALQSEIVIPVEYQNEEKELLLSVSVSGFYSPASPKLLLSSPASDAVKSDLGP